MVFSAMAGEKCNETVTFVKVHSVVPDTNNSILLYSSPGNAITAECQKRCLASSNCSGFLVDYSQASCFRSLNASTEISWVSNLEVPSNFFLRSCFNVPNSCKTKLWSLERVDGYELVGFSRVLFPNVESGIVCAQLCLSENKFECRSAMFYGLKKQCSLSSEDRRTQPSAYRASDSSAQYWENQCIPSPFLDKSCSLEEYTNSTILFADGKRENLTQYQCQQLCINETSFNCHGFTYVPTDIAANISDCFLHGDDTTSVGPRGVQRLAGATYWERVPCLPLQVTCSTTDMNVVLRSQDFRGRIYVLGRSDRCSTQGREGKDAVLKIPLWRQGREFNKCGVMMARSLGENNRTLVSAVVIVQYNPIIQRQGDRAVKVGCLVDSSSTKNITVGVSLSFSPTSANPSAGTTFVNSSGIPPTVSLYIVDPSKPSEELMEVVLGQNLQLRVDVVPEDSTYDIHVFNLVASSGDGSQSYFLLDQRGCPSDPQTFSALRRVRQGSHSLEGNFNAFKFPFSEVVRFQATVHFCPESCPSVECFPGVSSHGKRRRRQIPPPHSLFEELPVQLAIVVREQGPGSTEEFTASTEEFLTNLSGERIPDNVCLSWGAILGSIMAFILLQFAILATWFFVLHYRRHSRLQDEIKLKDDFGEYENRRVHWADS